MSNKTIFLIAVSALLFYNCDQTPLESDNSENSYLVFGRFYGECIGESCIEIFKIQNDALYEDTLDVYPTQNNLPHITSYIQLPHEKYEKAKHLLGHIPNDLFSEDTVRIGEPDAGDWGGFYLEVEQSGATKSWLIDTKKSNIPNYLHVLVDSLHSAIDNLQ